MLGSKLLTADPVRICTPFDPAIDHRESNVPLYTVVRDESLIMALAAAKVTWFTIRRLPRSIAGEIEATSPNRQVAQLRAFQLGVLRVDDLHLDSGEIRDCWTPQCRQQDGGRDPRQGLTRDETDLFPATERFDIGDVILRRADLRRGRQPFFPPPESSVRACGEELFLSAGESGVAASLQHGTPDKPSTALTRTQSGTAGTSGSRGAATAKGARKRSQKAKKTRGRTTRSSSKGTSKS